MMGHSQKMAGGTHKGLFYLGHEWGVSDILVTETEEVGGVMSERVRGYWGMGGASVSDREQRFMGTENRE